MGLGNTFGRLLSGLAVTGEGAIKNIMKKKDGYQKIDDYEVEKNTYDNPDIGEMIKNRVNETLNPEENNETNNNIDKITSINKENGRFL